MNSNHEIQAGALHPDGKHPGVVARSSTQVHATTRLRWWAVAGAGWAVLSLTGQGPAATGAPRSARCGDLTNPPGISDPATATLPGGDPIRAIHAHVCGFHFYSGDPKRALRADHYCSHLNRDVLQCIIYDSSQPNARLVGVEYIISEARFVQLPPEEKKLWHSHRYEVMSGQLVAPGLPGAAEQELMSELVNTYGKTWYLWQVDRGDQLPVGLPQLMMGFTADGQADAGMVAERDRNLKIDPVQVKARRATLPARPVATGADEGRQQQPMESHHGRQSRAPIPPTP